MYHSSDVIGPACKLSAAMRVASGFAVAMVNVHGADRSISSSSSLVTTLHITILL